VKPALADFNMLRSFDLERAAGADFTPTHLKARPPASNEDRGPCGTTYPHTIEAQLALLELDCTEHLTRGDGNVANFNTLCRNAQHRVGVRSYKLNPLPISVPVYAERLIDRDALAVRTSSDTDMRTGAGIGHCIPQAAKVA
jgi:hypothetical protein